MKKNLFDIISNIDPNIITESEEKVRTRPASYIALAATACALALCIGIGALYPIISKKANDPTVAELSETTGEDDALPPANDPAGKIINLSASINIPRESGKATDENFQKAYYDFLATLLKEQLKTTEENTNTLLSPLSAMYAMAMAANGAAGETLNEMEAVLCAGMTIDELNEYLTNLFSSLCTEGSGFTMANSIWFRDIHDLKVSEDYLNKNAQYYKAEIFKAPFNNDTKDSINLWASDNTDGMIKDVLQEIPEEARLYILNALLFDAKWKKGFRFKDEKGIFTDAEGNEHTVTMLNGPSEYRLYDVNAEGIIKKYDNGYSFFALLPKEGISAEEYVNNLTGEMLYNILNSAKKQDTLTYLPEFTTDYSGTLTDALQAMGIRDAFHPAKADFSAMATPPPLYLSYVKQFTKIDVTAAGTKAAAVTIIDTTKGSPFYIDPSDIIRFDRPFVYGIMKDDGTVLFTGVQNTME